MGSVIKNRLLIMLLPGVVILITLIIPINMDVYFLRGFTVISSSSLTYKFNVPYCTYAYLIIQLRVCPINPTIGGAEALLIVNGSGISHAFSFNESGLSELLRIKPGEYDVVLIGPGSVNVEVSGFIELRLVCPLACVLYPFCEAWSVYAWAHG